MTVGWSALLAAGAAAAVIPSPQQGAEPGAPISIQADRLEYHNKEDRYDAEGHVRLEQGGLRLTTDRLSYDNRTGRVEATGHVVLTEGDQQIDMERLEYNLRTQNGVMYEATLTIPELSYRLTGRRIERSADGTFRAEAATFTTCDTVCELGRPSWEFRARRLRVRLEHYLVASGVSLRVNDLPVAYLPWLIYPVKRERQSGLLIPEVGVNSSEGAKYLQPFYWVIGRSHDATVSLDLRSRIGIGARTEYRYRLSESGAGQINIDFFHHRTLDADFLSYHAEHQQTWGSRLQLEWNVNVVNRQDLFSELSSSTLERSRVGLESAGSLTYRLDEQVVYVAAYFTQSLVGQDDVSLQRLPEIGYRLIEYQLGRLPLYAGMQATAVHFLEGETLRFDERGGRRAFRLDLFPTLTARLDRLPGLTITPTAGVRETYYRSRSFVADGSLMREIVYTAVRADSQLMRRYGTVIHILQPALLYEYAHQLDDDTPPRFDEVDAAPEKRQVTMMLVNRVMRASAGRDIVWLRLSDSYRLRQSEAEPFSDLRIQAKANPLTPLTLSLETFVNFYRDGLTVFNSEVRWTEKNRLSVAVGQRYTRSGVIPQRGDLFSPETVAPADPIGGAGEITAINWSGQITLPWRMLLATRSLYDLHEKEFTEMTYGWRVRGGCNECWSMTLVYQQFPDERQVVFLVALRGVSGSSQGVKGLFQ